MEALSCRLLPWEVADGPTNMAADEVLVRTAAERGIASLRFYGWSPATLSLGYFQMANARLDDPRLAALPFVRRPSGGAALVHHHEVTYALAVPPGREWHAGGPWMPRMHEMIARALNRLLQPTSQIYAVSAPEFGDAKTLQQQTGAKIQDALVNLDYATMDDIMSAIGEHSGMQAVNLTDMNIPQSIIEMVPEAVARENIIIPLSHENSVLKIVVHDPGDYETISKLQFILNKDIRPVLATKEQIVEAINRHYGQIETESVDSMLSEFTDTQMRQAGATLCFQKWTVGDLLCQGFKIVGSAQRKYRGALMQHGSILLRRSEYAPALPGLEDLTGVTLPTDRLGVEISCALALATGWQLVFAEWSAEERNAIPALVREKYGTSAWNERR